MPCISEMIKEISSETKSSAETLGVKQSHPPLVQEDWRKGTGIMLPRKCLPHHFPSVPVSIPPLPASRAHLKRFWQSKTWKSLSHLPPLETQRSKHMYFTVAQNKLHLLTRHKEDYLYPVLSDVFISTCWGEIILCENTMTFGYFLRWWLIMTLNVSKKYLFIAINLKSAKTDCHFPLSEIM